MKTMKTKMFVTFLSLFAIVCLSACGVNVKTPDTEVKAGPDGVNVKTPGTEVNVGTDGVNANVGNTDNSNDASQGNKNDNRSSSKDSTLKALTPPGATVTANTSDGSAILTSKMTLKNLITFYQGALKSLGAQETSALEYAGNWNYIGTYSNGKEIMIQITGDTISITY